MNSRILYFIAAALAWIAAALYYFGPGAGDDVGLRAGLLALMGAVMLWLGLRKPPPTI